MSSASMSLTTVTRGDCCATRPSAARRPERFAQRGAAHPESRGLLHFAEHRTEGADRRTGSPRGRGVGAITGSHAQPASPSPTPYIVLHKRGPSASSSSWTQRRYTYRRIPHTSSRSSCSLSSQICEIGVALAAHDHSHPHRAASPSTTAASTPSTVSTSTSTRDRCTASSARTARARPPPSASCWASRARRAARHPSSAGDPWRDAVALHRRIAYVPGDVSIWPNLVGRRGDRPARRLRGARSTSSRLSRRADAAHGARSSSTPAKKGRAYSKGNRQKVALIAAFARAGRPLHPGRADERAGPAHGGRSSATRSRACGPAGAHACCCPATSSPRSSSSAIGSRSSARAASWSRARSPSSATSPAPRCRSRGRRCPPPLDGIPAAHDPACRRRPRAVHGGQRRRADPSCPCSPSATSTGLRIDAAVARGAVPASLRRRARRRGAHPRGAAPARATTR